MTLAHLHPILVHFTLSLGVIWCLADLFFSRNNKGEKEKHIPLDPGRSLEGLLILIIVTVTTGWISLAIREKEGGPGAVFPPGRVHGDFALLTLSLLLFRFILAVRQPSSPPGKKGKGIAATLSLLALLSFLITGILGERLVFHNGVTAKKSPPLTRVPSVT